MDSGNSGSLQSSSGGDEEYDSRAADSVSAFMTAGSGGTIPNLQPHFFEPLSTYMQLQNSSLLNNSNLSSWPRISAPPLRSDPNSTHQDMFPTQSPAPFMPAFQGIGVDSGAASASPQTPQAARNPKKRSRASRRAPTTVLTTDTTNFRAMVQEFTGIPAPPFNSSSFPRSRLDFLGSRSGQTPPYLRRPFAQKVQPPHPFSSSAAMNYQLPMTQTSNHFNINPNQNILASLLQSNPKFPFSTSSIIPSNDCQFGVGSETLAGLPSLIPSDAGNAASWANGDPVPLRHKDATYDFERAKMSSFSASSTHGGKAPENNANANAARGEGMVESWICSSE